MLELKTKIVFDPKNVTKKHVAQSHWKKTIICTTECDIDLYYTWILNKRFNLVLNKQLRKPHITIVNDKIVDFELYEQAKKLFNGKELTFKYDPSEIRTNGQHWWIKVYSDDIENIRTVMDLTPKPHFNLHLTIGYVQDGGIRLEHSKYIHDMILFYNL